MDLNLNFLKGENNSKESRFEILRCDTLIRQRGCLSNIKIPRSGERRAHELPEAHSQGGETECQYLSGGQYSALKSRQFSAIVISNDSNP